MKGAWDVTGGAGEGCQACAMERSGRVRKRARRGVRASGGRQVIARM
jgi:hypothetical protein